MRMLALALEEPLKCSSILDMKVLALSTVLGIAPLIAGSMALSIIMNATLSDLSHWALAFSYSAF
jgi:hypothetical protein